MRDPDEAKSIRSYPDTEKSASARSFFGSMLVLQRFADIAKPLHKLTESNTTFQRT